MSTRSGKRLHNSPANISLKENEEKTHKSRSRRGKAKASQDVSVNPPKTKKRKDYVSYPSEEEVAAPAPPEPEPRPSRALRKHALKEHNAASDSPPQTLRHTRRTRKFAEEEPPQVTEEKNSEKKAKKKKKKKLSIDVKENENVPGNQANLPVTTKSKKNKKAKISSPIEDKAQIRKKLNDTNTSVSSYHSAFGSPEHPSDPELASVPSPQTTLVEQTLISTFDKTTTPKGEIKNYKDNKLSIDNTDQEADKVESLSLRNSIIRVSTTQHNFETLNRSSESIKTNSSLTKPMDTTFDKNDPPVNTTLDKSSSNSPAIPDSTVNLTFEKSDISRISINSDSSKTENILNTTPVMVESSMESIVESPATLPEPIPTLIREGTFTKDGPDPIIMSPKLKTTPENGKTSLLTAGCTPYHSGTRVTRKSIMNRTHSIEKPIMMSLAEPARSTRVMFCSPVNNPLAASQRKTKVIKSSMKGSNKSFVYEEKEPRVLPGGGGGGGGRKRSRTADADAGCAKRSRLSGPQRASVDRLSRPRTGSASAAKPPPPSPPRATRLPDFASLHARSFERMESLDALVRRRARRARGLLAAPPTTAAKDRTTASKTSTAKKEPAKNAAKPTPALASALAPAPAPASARLERGYSRFGFKLSVKNPFSVPPKEKPRAKDTPASAAAPPNPPNPFSVPAKAKEPGARPPATDGAARRQAARAAARREPPAPRPRREGAREENRTIIKGVRTNRRFELQMQSRNIQA